MSTLPDGDRPAARSGARRSGRPHGAVPAHPTMTSRLLRTHGCCSYFSRWASIASRKYGNVSTGMIAAACAQYSVMSPSGKCSDPEQCRVVASQPAPEHRLVGARHDADGVELNAAKSADHLQHPRFLHSGSRVGRGLRSSREAIIASALASERESDSPVTATFPMATESPSPSAQGRVPSGWRLG